MKIVQIVSTTFPKNLRVKKETARHIYMPSHFVSPRATVNNDQRLERLITHTPFYIKNVYNNDNSENASNVVAS